MATYCKNRTGQLTASQRLAFQECFIFFLCATKKVKNRNTVVVAFSHNVFFLFSGFHCNNDLHGQVCNAHDVFVSIFVIQNNARQNKMISSSLLLQSSSRSGY